jgi:hypothetical protein
VRIEKPTNEFGILLDYRGLDNDTTPVPKSDGNCDVCEVSWKNRAVLNPVLKFLEYRCWVLSLLVHKIHEDKPLTDDRTKCLEQLFSSKCVGALKPVFDNNAAVTALHSKPGVAELWSLLNNLVERQEWHQCAEILWALPETELLDDPKLQKFHDVVMYEQASKLPVEGKVFSVRNKDQCCMIKAVRGSLSL